METLVLQPCDLLGVRFGPRPSSSDNPNPRLKSSPSYLRKRSHNGTMRRRSRIPSPPSSPKEKSPAKRFVMGAVRILKRGEEVDPNKRKEDAFVAAKGKGDKDLVLFSTDRLGPGPETASKHLRVSDLYAGAACYPSPPPSSLPFPAGLIKGGGGGGAGCAVAIDLRRLLRI